MTEEPRHLPHQRLDQLSDIEWHGFLGADNVEAITDRVKRIVVPGRTFVIVKLDSGPTRVEPGLSLYVKPEAFRAPITWSSGEHGGGFSVSMWPGIRGFGASFDSTWDMRIGEPPHPMTGEEVCATVRSEEKYRRRFDWSWIHIHGGIDSPRHQDRITIRKCNEHGYEETIEVIPADMPWQLRHARDAMVADQLADVLGQEVDDEWHPAAGVEPEQAKTAADALRTVAANLRKSREPLVREEAYPVFPEMQ